MTSIERREAQARAFFPMLRRIARRVKRMVPMAEFGDLLGEGSIGLLVALDAFDPSHGTSLRYYVRRKIVCAMLNGLRRMDPVSERARRLVRVAEEARYKIAAQRGEMPTLAELEHERPKLARAHAAVHYAVPLSFDQVLPDDTELVVDWSNDPARLIEHNEECRWVRRAVGSLPERQRCLIARHYFGQRSLRRIGTELGISSQRASQLHHRAVAALRRAHEDAHENPPMPRHV